MPGNIRQVYAYEKSQGHVLHCGFCPGDIEGGKDRTNAVIRMLPSLRQIGADQWIEILD